MPTRPELPPHYTIKDIRVDSFYAGGSSDEIPYCVFVYNELAAVGDRWFASVDEASSAAWAHWREHGPKQWVEYLDEQREPFEGFLDVTDEQRAVAQAMADAYEKHVKGLDSDTVILGAHLAQFSEHVIESLKLTGRAARVIRFVFGNVKNNARSEAASLMMAKLLRRLYETPYEGINMAAVDLVDVLVPVIGIAVSETKKLKHPGG